MARPLVERLMVAVRGEFLHHTLFWFETHTLVLMGYTLAQRDAEKKLSAMHLAVGHVRMVANTDRRKTGLVQKQDPYKGTSVPYGERINLWIWDRPPRSNPVALQGAVHNPHRHIRPRHLQL